MVYCQDLLLPILIASPLLALHAKQLVIVSLAQADQTFAKFLVSCATPEMGLQKWTLF